MQDSRQRRETPFSEVATPRKSCIFFQYEACFKGDRCRFTHEVPKRAVTEVTVRALDDAVFWYQSPKGPIVRCEDGAAVTGVKSPAECSAVRIEGLCRDATKATVVLILASLGFTITEDCVATSPYPDANGTQRIADVVVDDPEFAGRLCDVLARTKHANVTATPHDIAQTNTLRSHQVLCSWEKPTQCATLVFGPDDEAIADAVCSGFSAGEYRILGRQVRCWRILRRGINWAVELRDLPARTKTADIAGSLPDCLLPIGIRLDTNILTNYLSDANQGILSLLLGLGPMEYWLASEKDVPGDQFQAVGAFRSNTMARRAVSKLHGREFPFLCSGKLTVQLVYSVNMRVQSDTYAAAEQDVAEFSRLRMELSPDLFIGRRQLLGAVEIRIVGPHAEAVITTRDFLARLVCGVVVMNDGEPLWAPSFAVPGLALRSVKQTERDHGVVVFIDALKSQLRLLGPRQQFEKARAALVHISAASLTGIYNIELNDQQFSRAFRGGLRAIAAAVGYHNIRMDMLSSPHRLVLTGSDADLALVQGVLSGKRAAPTSAAGSLGNCTICWTEAEAPVLTSCNHIYCSGCLEDMCSAGVKDDPPRIRCHGADGECGFVFPIAELEMHLGPSSLDHILETAFATHIARHPNSLRYCPTPECGQIYRPINASKGVESSPLHTCPGCLTDLCASCNGAWHAGLSCAEYSKRCDSEALARAKKDLGIRDCPKCGTGIERTGGCDHITCEACKTHICWNCMRIFRSGKLTYEHMMKEHGGIGRGYRYYPELAEEV